ncbi:hypothetical protein BH18ACT4_BH18ACT4_08610 [soil metagenome]
MSSTARRIVAGAAVATLLVKGSACTDEDGDGAVTDEEIEDVEDNVSDVGSEINEEIECQYEGTNEDGE